MENNSTQNSSVNRLLIHLGYHKTGTSYLQRVIFNDTDSGYCLPVNRHELRNVFVSTGSFEFDAEEIREQFQSQVGQTPDNLVPVLSHEQLSGQPYGGGYGLRKREREVSRREIADRLYSCFPEAKILIVIREQKEMIRSIYKFLVCGWQGRLSARIEQFLDQSPLQDGYSPLFKLDYLEYHQLIRYYQELFGKSSVLVLPYELFRDDPLHFINQIRNFSGLETIDSIAEYQINVSPSAAICSIRRVTNRFIVSPNKPGTVSRNEKRVAALVSKLKRYIPGSIQEKAEKTLIQKINQAVDGVYAESNQTTSKLTGLNLGKLGYEMPI